MMKMRYRNLGFLVGVVILTTACASVGRLNQNAESFTREAINQSELNRCTVHAAPCLDDAAFKAVNVELNKIAVAGREFTKLQLAGTATIKDASTFLSVVAAEQAILARTFNTGAAKTVLDAVAQLQAKIISLMGKF